MFSFFNQTFTANMNLKERIFILPLIKVSFNTYVITNIVLTLTLCTVLQNKPHSGSVSFV